MIALAMPEMFVMIADSRDVADRMAEVENFRTPLTSRFIAGLRLGFPACTALDCRLRRGAFYSSIHFFQDFSRPS